MPFACSICEQESTKICVFCTKDACDNHLCERCGCCSDCCECEVPLEEAAPHARSHESEIAAHPASAEVPAQSEAAVPLVEGLVSESSGSSDPSET